LKIQVGDMLKFEDESGVSFCIIRNLYDKQTPVGIRQMYDVAWLVTKGFQDCEETSKGYETETCFGWVGWSKIS